MALIISLWLQFSSLLLLEHVWALEVCIPPVHEMLTHGHGPWRFGAVKIQLCFLSCCLAWVEWASSHLTIYFWPKTIHTLWISFILLLCKTNFKSQNYQFESWNPTYITRFLNKCMKSSKTCPGLLIGIDLLNRTRAPQEIPTFSVTDLHNTTVLLSARPFLFLINKSLVQVFIYAAL